MNAQIPASPADHQVAVAISGGGYRATAWGLGVLWALVAGGVNQKVTMISSVSGGSLMNAYAAQSTPFRDQTATSFDVEARKLTERLAGRPLAFDIGIAGTALAAIAGTVLAALGYSCGMLGAALLMLAFGLFGALGSKDLLCNRFETWLYFDALLGFGIAIAWAWPSPWLVTTTVIGLGIVALARGPVVGWSMGRSLQRLSGSRGSTLGDMNAEPMHVILATELRAGHHACFARNFVYCYDLGLGNKPSLPLRVAVQASANFPGAFPTRWISTAGIDFLGGDHHVSFLATTDGGVYDNMGDQWPMGLPARIKRLRAKPDVVANPGRAAALDELAEQAPTFVIVANASGALGYRSVGRSAIPLLGEVLGLLQVKDVLYDNGTSVRREALISNFDRGDPAGTLIHIASAPDVLARRAAAAEPSSRAANALAYAELWGDESTWKQRADAATGVGTQLWPVGADKVHNVIRCAYVQTAVNLYLKGVTDQLPEPPSW